MSVIPRSLATRILASVVGCALAGTASPAMARKKPLPEPCPAARYLIAGGPIGANGLVAQLGTTSAVDGVCGAVAAKRYKANRQGTTQVLVKWKQCTGMSGAVTLQGKILPGCTQFQGTLKAKKLKRSVAATQSRCGDGFIDAGRGEACDDGNTTPGDGCEASCTPTPPPSTTTSTTSPVPTTTIVTSSSTTTTIGSSSSSTSTTPGSTATTSTALVSTTTSSTTTSSTTTTTLPKTVLELSMVANPDPIAAGDLITYQLTATNRGPVDAVQAQLRMTLPVGLFDCRTPSDGGQFPTGCGATKDVLWTLGTMAVGSSRTVQLVVLMRSDVANGSTVTASGRLDDAAHSPQATANSSVAVLSSPPLALGLTTDADPVELGGDLEYVVRFGNRSANALLNTQLALDLPDGVTVLDVGGGAQASGRITWNVGSLTATTTGERRVRVHVENLGGGDPLVRIARATVTSGSNVAHATTVTQIQSSVLGLELVADPDPVDPKGPVISTGLLTYRLTVTNRGMTDAGQVQVHLTLPTGIFSCGAASDGGTEPSGCVAGQDVLWTVGTLAAGTSRSEQLPIQLRSDVPAGSIVSAAARAEEAAGSRARAALGTIAQISEPLGVVLTTSANPVQIGDDLEYVVSYGNRGDDALLGTQLALTLPQGVTVVDAGGGAQASGAITWSPGALGSEETGERRVRVHIDDLGAGDPLVRVARAAVSSGTHAARATVVTQLQESELGLALVADPDPLDVIGPVAPSGMLTYRLTVTNRLAIDAEQVELRLTLPVGVFDCPGLSDGGTSPNGCGSGTDVVWALGTLPAGRSRSVHAVLGIRSNVPAGMILSTTARVQDAGGARTLAALGTAAQSTPPLVLELTTDADPVQTGDFLEYVLRYGNRGANALLGAQLVLTLPAGVAIIDPDGGTADADTITWSLGTLDAGETGAHRVRVLVTNLGLDDFLVRAARAAVTSGSNAARSSVVTQVQPTTLGLQLVAEPNPIDPAGPEQPTGQLTYLLTVTNHGLDDAVQVELRLTLPLGVFGCGPASDGGTMPNGCGVGQDVQWNLDTLRAGESRTEHLLIQIRGDVPNGMILSATARVEDAAGSHTRAAATTPAHGGAPLAVVVTEDANPVVAGDDLEYVVRFGNHGAAALLSAQLGFVVPPGTTVLDADGGAQANGTITWALGTLDPGEIGAHVVRVHVEALAEDDPDVRVGRAFVASGETAAEASVVTEVQPSPLALTMTADPDPVKAAGLLTYHLTVTNHGHDDSVQSELRLALPVGLFNCGTLSDGGTLPQGCGVGRDVVWQLGTLGSGETRSVHAVVQLRSDVDPGRIVFARARVDDAAGSRARAAVSTAVQK